MSLRYDYFFYQRVNSHNRRDCSPWCETSVMVSTSSREISNALIRENRLNISRLQNLFIFNNNLKYIFLNRSLQRKNRMLLLLSTIKCILFIFVLFTKKYLDVIFSLYRYYIYVDYFFSPLLFFLLKNLKCAIICTRRRGIIDPSSRERETRGYWLEGRYYRVSLP